MCDRLCCALLYFVSQSDAWLVSQPVCVTSDSNFQFDKRILTNIQASKNRRESDLKSGKLDLPGKAQINSWPLF